MLIDTHAHLTSAQVADRADALVERARRAGVERVVNICTDRPSLEKGLALRERAPWIYNTAATTPHDLVEEGELFFPLVEAAVAKKQLVAVGETGLDYFYAHAPRALQQAFLSRYFALALSAGLPLVIHCRDAFADLFAQADSEYRGAPAILHCFTGSLEEARGVLERGWYLSFSGIVTYKKSVSLRDVVKFAPLDRILVETDTPYLAPQSHRGQENEPAYLVETAALVAELKQISFEALAQATSENACEIFPF